MDCLFPILSFLSPVLCSLPCNAIVCVGQRHQQTDQLLDSPVLSGCRPQSSPTEWL